MKKKYSALAALVFTPIAILPLSIVFGELGIIQLTLPDGQPTLWGFVTDYSNVWVLIAVPLLFIPYFFDLYRGTERRGFRLLSLMCVELVVYVVPFIFLSTQPYIPGSFLWFYVSPFVTLFAGYAIKGGQSNVTNESQRIRKSEQDVTRSNMKYAIEHRTSRRKNEHHTRHSAVSSRFGDLFSSKGKP